jgi:hypothetical protein
MKRMRVVFFFLAVALMGAVLGGVAAASPGNRPMPPIITSVSF